MNTHIMKESFLKAFWFYCFSLALFGVTYAAISWPSSAPSGEVAGGKFATVLNSILSSSSYQAPGDGTVKRAASTATAGMLFPDGNTQTKAFQGISTIRPNNLSNFTLANGASVNYVAYCNAGEVLT